VCRYRGGVPAGWPRRSGVRDGPRGVVVADQDAQAGGGSATDGGPVIAALGPEHPECSRDLVRLAPVPAQVFQFGRPVVHEQIMPQYTAARYSSSPLATARDSDLSSTA